MNRAMVSANPNNYQLVGGFWPRENYFFAKKFSLTPSAITKDIDNRGLWLFEGFCAIGFIC